jgi:uncharacterized protein YbjT (DUF2867 family)
MNTPKILIIGANGQIGSELTQALAQRYGAQSVITSEPSQPVANSTPAGPGIST